MDDGLLDPDELREAASAGAVDTVVCAFVDHYGRLVGKRLDAAFFCERMDAGTHACDYLLTVDMEMEPVDGYEFANWERGYGDVHMHPDLSTLRRLTWLDRTAFVMCDVEDHAAEPVAVAPRTILSGQIARARASGFDVKAASELEYFAYRTSYEDAARRGYTDLDAAGWYLEDYQLLQGTRAEDIHGSLRRHLAASGIPVESTKGEWGRGQHEINVRYASVLDSADRHVLVKQCAKEIAETLEASVTFMAKPSADGAGSSCHLHLSLWRGEEPAFPGDGDLGGVRCSDEFRWFLGGWMAHLADLMVCYAPTVNSYKRYQSQSWAPTASAWSVDNRTAAFRVVGQGPTLRIECRVPGADVNPYMAYAASIAAGLAGIEKQIEPPPPHVGDVYSAEGFERVPTSLAAAVERFEASELARAAFGVSVVDHYSHFHRREAAAYEAAVTDWERRRYFERI